MALERSHEKLGSLIVASLLGKNSQWIVLLYVGCLVMIDEIQPPEIHKDSSKAHIARLQQELHASKNKLLEMEELIQSQRALIQQQLEEIARKQILKEEMLVFFYFFRPFLRPLMWPVRLTCVEDVD